jgi:uncharacterized protein YggE
MRCVIGLALAALATCLLTAVRAEDRRVQTPSITVTGTGEATARPDMAQIQVGVVTQATTAGAALKENSAAVEQLLKALRDRGIAERDLQTSNFNIAPQYRQTQGQHAPEIVGYQVSNQVQVKVRRLDSLGTLLDEAVSKGANQVNGISFGLAEPGPFLDQAREKAVAEARRKAELYARAAGVKLGKVLVIDENQHHGPQPMFVGHRRRRAAATGQRHGDLCARVAGRFRAGGGS